MTCDAVHDEFARRVDELLAEWNASYAAAGVACASPLMDRALAERQVAEEMGLVEVERECRVCECTDEWGCLVPGDRGLLDACEWVEDDLCSACAESWRPVVDVEVQAGVL